MSASIEIADVYIRHLLLVSILSQAYQTDYRIVHRFLLCIYIIAYMCMVVCLFMHIFTRPIKKWEITHHLKDSDGITHVSDSN